MNDTRFRLIFEGLDNGAQLKKLVVYFQKELGLSEDAIRNLLTNPPRVLWDVSSRDDAELIEGTLEKMGCRAYSEPVTWNASYPFPIALKHHKIMKQELSKILRVKANLALFLVQVAARNSGAILPSMMGPFRDKLEEHFRESDTVIGIDDSRIIILGFSTDREGVQHLENKTNRVLEELLGDDILVTTGFSLFPQEGRSLPGLIHLAEQKREGTPSPELNNEEIAHPQEPVSHGRSATEHGKHDSLQRCFTEARGNIFRRLLSLSPETLWHGLCQLPETTQREFLARLPFDSPLCPVLAERIETQCAPKVNEAESHHFEAIIHQMELEEGLSERLEMKKRILSKLNRIETLPTLPSIASHVFKIASNPNSSAEDLTKVIVNDPPLTSKLLKIVNSAFYGFPQKIGTVKQVVVILGTEEIMDLAFGLAAAKVFKTKSVEGLGDPKALWHHSMSTALIAQNLCQNFPNFQNLGAFTAGLLHDFGKIFLMENFSEPYGQLHLDGADKNLPVFELEEERFGLNHAVLGEFLASNWNLPDDLVKAIAFHHQPFSAAEHAQLAAIIGLADYLHYQTTLNNGANDHLHLLPPGISFGHWNILTKLFKGLDSEALTKMAEEASTTLEESQDLFALLD